ncbi:GNAT family N-acetyltransferase [Shouchella sp. JSM 1781072]|uniref:GNAT family N-acetyltransferase n=1 Tax=Bacillaceae TaxID=186817 RepID=UPI00159BA26C|nr:MULTISPECIES: GNAT family N-acetyltransferase [Bacillaceae]UTR07464.1 GNAT family N-acetyltransferase [Alkalihalobacillus sp. LMS6]
MNMYSPSLPSFHTNRLLIRPPLKGDGEKLFESVQFSKADLSPWLPWVNQITTVSQAEEAVQFAYQQFIDLHDLRFHLFERHSLAFIGSVGFHEIKWSVPRMEIGYWLDSRYQGKGYMIEAIKPLLPFAFNQLSVHRLELRCDPLNKKSRTVAEKLDFKLEAILKENERATLSNGYADTCVYAMLRSAFHKKTIDT